MCERAFTVGNSMQLLTILISVVIPTLRWGTPGV